MLKLIDGIVELYKKAATSLPPDVESVIIDSANKEEADSSSSNSLKIIGENIRMSRREMTPICQDTGIPIFFVQVPKGVSQREIKDIIYDATRKATDVIPLRPNAVDPVSGINSGNNTGEGFPVIYFDESENDTLRIDLILKGGGSENIGMTYKLPDKRLNAQRNLDGVRKCVIDAVFNAQGRACPPYIVGVGIGATKDQVALLSKKQLLRKINDRNISDDLAALESSLTEETNRLGIGPMGFGGVTTVLGVKAASNHRHPATYLVDVSFSCWASRRGTLLW